LEGYFGCGFGILKSLYFPGLVFVILCPYTPYVFISVNIGKIIYGTQTTD